MSGVTPHLGVFAKYWEPGKVKTRLAVTIGNQAAATVYRVFVDILLRRFSDTGCSRELVFSPDSREQEFRECVAEHQGKWVLQPQGPGDLGERMHRFFQRTLAHSRKVILIGTDSPTFSADHLGQTNELLDHKQVVLGPSEDGGYYLVAANGAVPPIFSDIDWETNRVCQQTVDKLESNGVSYATLPEWYDVDDESDLRRLFRETNNVSDNEIVGTLNDELTRALLGSQWNEDGQ